MKIRKEVMWFARRMELKLRENDHKDHWTGCDFEYLFRRLMEESTELHAAFLDDQIDEAADVANFAMMIADNAHKSNAMHQTLRSPRSARVSKSLLHAFVRLCIVS